MYLKWGHPSFLQLDDTKVQLQFVFRRHWGQQQQYWRETINCLFPPFTLHASYSLTHSPSLLQLSTVTNMVRINLRAYCMKVWRYEHWLTLLLKEQKTSFWLLYLCHAAMPGAWERQRGRKTKKWSKLYLVFLSRPCTQTWDFKVGWGCVSSFSCYSVRFTSFLAWHLAAIANRKSSMSHVLVSSFLWL